MCICSMRQKTNRVNFANHQWNQSILSRSCVEGSKSRQRRSFGLSQVLIAQRLQATDCSNILRDMAKDTTFRDCDEYLLS